jgi:DNA replication and repair protein RecF
MSLQRLEISNIRNIDSALLTPSPAVNIIIGDNGSGKTSLLESIYFLGSARTFRSSSTDPLICRDSQDCMVKGQLRSGLSLAVQRQRGGKKTLRIAGQPVSKTSELAVSIPIAVLEPQTINLIIGPPEGRRRFLNWGVFHVEPTFRGIWGKAIRCLKQRNELLKQGRREELGVWTREFACLSEAIHDFRARYMEAYGIRFSQSVCGLTGLDDISVSYQPGWNPARALQDQLEEDLNQDIKRGYSGKGFHRADVKITVAGDDAAKTCSRGELKVLSWALLLVQGESLGHELIYLLDDVISELDTEHRNNICEYLVTRNRQIFTTGTDRQAMMSCWGDSNVFHVKHGVISGESA